MKISTLFRTLLCTIPFITLLTPLSVSAVQVPWEFEIYREADFGAEVVQRLAPQFVNIVEYGEDDWVLIEADTGTGWLNLRYPPAVDKLDEFFKPLGNNIAVYYKNLDTGFTYVHNSGRVLFAASLSKSNHARYVYELAERGELDMYEVQTYTRQDEWGGTGIMRFMPVGTTFTTRELLGLSITQSDNAAFRMLVRLTANASFTYRQFVSQIGADSNMIRDIISQNTHIRDMGLWLESIYDYIESDSLYGHYLKYDMLNTAQTSHPYFTRWEGSNGVGGEVNTRMLLADYPIARKYGWARNAFHDAGIVYAPSPYILIVLSNMERGAHDTFADISWFVQKFNNRTFVRPSPLDAPFCGPEMYAEQTAHYATKNSFRLTIPVFAELEDMV
ncbi:MAG: serine hydrolase [Defluviitaleaceae bacterium]|nr:serine hydrolase [Defluviitaleaceae bacterium]